MRAQFVRGQNLKKTLKLGWQRYFNMREIDNMPYYDEDEDQIFYKNAIKNKMPKGEKVYWLAYGDSEDEEMEMLEYLEEKIPKILIGNIEKIIDEKRNYDHGTLALYQDKEDKKSFYIEAFESHASNWFANLGGAQKIFKIFPDVLKIIESDIYGN